MQHDDRIIRWQWERALRDPTTRPASLSKRDIAVAWAAASILPADGTWRRLGVDELVDATGWSDKRVRVAIDVLADAGVLEVHRDSRRAGRRMRLRLWTTRESGQSDRTESGHSDRTRPVDNPPSAVTEDPESGQSDRTTPRPTDLNPSSYLWDDTERTDDHKLQEEEVLEKITTLLGVVTLGHDTTAAIADKLTAGWTADQVIHAATINAPPADRIATPDGFVISRLARHADPPVLQDTTRRPSPAVALGRNLAGLPWGDVADALVADGHDDDAIDAARTAWQAQQEGAAA